MQDARLWRSGMVCQSYKDLKIYQRAYQLCIEIHEMSLSLPKFELYEEGSQIRRSIKSVLGDGAIKMNLSNFWYTLRHPVTKQWYI